jgi:phytoene/squalene synthetase
MDRIHYYQDHLNRVSRSFSFCIAKLEGDLREWVSVSYLLCRILDTVEDSTWGDTRDQERAFQDFAGFLVNAPSVSQIQVWAKSFPPNIDSGERALIEDSWQCFAFFHQLPVGVREKIRRPVMNMYRGMRHFSNKKDGQGNLRLRTLAEVNQYCFFVAGLVGELLTDLVNVKWGVGEKKICLRDAHHFGLFLQKINLLKDQKKDEEEGRFFIHSRQEVLQSMLLDAEGAIRYLQSLPLAEKGYRTFCAWSLFLGLGSLPWIEQSSLMGKLMKIPRMATELLLKRVESVIDDNQALVLMFREMLPAKRANLNQTASGDTAWMLPIYEGGLKQEDFRALGLCSN